MRLIPLLLCLTLPGCSAASTPPPSTPASPSVPALAPPGAPAPVASATPPATPATTSGAIDDASPPAATAQDPGWLGVELAKPEGEQPGVLIRSVLRGSPAERAGLSNGDVVQSIDGQSVASPSELRAHVLASHAGARVSLGVLRGGATRLLAVVLEALPNDDEVMRRNYVGAPAPDFGALDTVQGSITPSLRALKGRVVVLEFWASWCGVCHVLAPTLNGWSNRYSAQGLTVLGVTGDSVEVASRTAGELGLSYALASDSSGNMLRAYRAYALPTLFVIDKHGNVRDVLIGYSSPRLREIEALVRKLIAEG